MTHSGSEYEGFTQPLGAISVGDGKQVLPAPEIPESYNPLQRNYESRDFHWNSYTAVPVGVGEASGLIPIPQEVPSSYILEITPDLGWPNKEELFEPYVADYPDAGNALLRRFTNLVVGVDLTAVTIADSPADYMITYNVDRADFIKIISPDYDRYLWRVFSVREDGIESFPSVIQKFKSKVIVADLDWSIDPVDPQGLTITLQGSRTHNIKTIEIDGNTGNTVLLGANRWASDVNLVNTSQEFFLRAIDTTDNTSAYQSIIVDLPTDTQDYQSVWNNFDELGMLVDLERIPQENNVNYKRRIIDVYKHRAGPRYKGLINGVTRELDLSFDDRGLLITPGTNTGTKQDFEDISLKITPKYITVDAPFLKVVNEYHRLDTWDWSITLNNQPLEDNISIESPLGNHIPSRNNWVVEDNKVVFEHTGLIESPIYASYTYVERYDLSTGTVADATGWLNTVSFNNMNLLSADTGATIDTGSPATYLALTPRTIVARARYQTFANDVATGLPIRWTDGSLRLLSNDEFQDIYTNAQNNLFGTQVETWAKFLQSYIHTQWGFLIADRNVWGSKERPLHGYTVLPTNYDPPFAHWQATSPVINMTYNSVQAYGYNYVVPGDGTDMQYRGIASATLRSGIGDDTDLLVEIVSEDATQLVQSDNEVLTTVQTTVRDTVDTVGDPIINSGDGTLPGCGVLIV